LPPDVANAHRGSLKVFISESGEELSSPTEFLLRDHEVLLTEVFEDAPAGALCVCGERWRWTGGDEDQRTSFTGWASAHTL
jgi:hypothetical protein